MQILNVIVVVILAINIILPFALPGIANKWSNALGWGLAIMWFCIAKYST